MKFAVFCVVSGGGGMWVVIFMFFARSVVYSIGMSLISIALCVCCMVIV